MADGVGTRRRAAPWGLIGALVLIVGVERSISRRIVSVTSDAASNYVFAAKAATREGVRSEILGFGDSLVKFGFQPKVIQARTGRTAFNLAAYGAGPARDYQVLKRVLDAGGKPSALVVCFHVVHLGTGSRYHMRQFAETVTPAEALDLAWSSGDAGLFGWLMLARDVPSIRSRDELRGNVMTALGGAGTDWAEICSILTRNWSQGRGAHLQHNDPHAPEDATAARTLAMQLYPANYDDYSDKETLSKRYIRRFLDLASERHIPVFWVIPPMLPAVEQRHREMRATELTNALVKQMQAAYPNVIVVDARSRGYDARAFATDAVHLNRRGATTLSRDLGDLIRHRLGEPSIGPSWVSLPRYRPVEDGFGMEDLAQSSAAVHQSREVRR